MNILWLTNIQLPEASMLLGKETIPFGGWLVNTSKEISDRGDINLYVAFPQQGLSQIRILKGEKINYYFFSPVTNKDRTNISFNTQFEEILEIVKPQIVHIFGTEYPHTLSMVNTCKKMNIKTVISIQGLVSKISLHYMACLPNKIQNMFTFRDFIKQDNLKQQQKKFAERGKYEVEAIQKVHYVIGRTNWDKACTTQINPNIKYYFCNETLRDEFYKHEWSLDKCDRFTIFISQAGYPIKGLHFLLEAMPFIIKKFPDTKLYVAGTDIAKSKKIMDRLKKTSYAKYIQRLIKKLNLEDRVKFTGLLNEKEMCERFLKSNIFVCPSSIENESNSLSEAKILGVPCVASYVGGMTDRITNKYDGFFYQTDAPYMLAYYICEIFGNGELANRLSKNAREQALQTHDREENLKTFLNIYKDIVDE